MLSAAAGAVAAVTLTPAAADPGAPPGDRADAARKVTELFAEAERAVEEYNGTAERVGELEREAERGRDLVAHGQDAVNRQRRALGSAAAAHYRSGGVNPSLTLLLSPDPDGYLHRAAVLERAGARQAGELTGLLRAQRRLEQRRTETEEKLSRLAAEREELGRKKEAVQRKLSAARRQYEQLTERERRERERAARGAGRHPDGLPGPEAEAAAPRAAAAVAAARRAVGRPYGWGQSGPSAFDCSGLVQWSYRQAGVSLPRTSQGQAGAGARVPLSGIRPGDIVVYRDDASHVGLYTGGGRVVHAPYPGARVRYDPVGMMPVTAVVRP